MDEFDLYSVLSDNCSVVEFYIAPQRLISADANERILVGWKGDTSHKLPSNWNMTQTNMIHTYFYRDLAYSFDASNDAQRVVRQTFLKDCVSADRCYVLSLQEDVLPCHRFPCVSDITHKTEIERRVHRINNRIFVYHDYDKSENMSYLYVRYNHASNVDVNKMNQDIHTIVRKLMRLH